MDYLPRLGVLPAPPVVGGCLPFGLMIPRLEGSNFADPELFGGGVGLVSPVVDVAEPCGVGFCGRGASGCWWGGIAHEPFASRWEDCGVGWRYS